MKVNIIALIFIGMCGCIYDNQPHMQRADPKPKVEPDIPFAWNVCEKLDENMTTLQRREYADNKWEKLVGTKVDFYGVVQDVSKSYRYTEDYSDIYEVFVISLESKYDTVTKRINLVLLEKDSLYNSLHRLNRYQAVYVQGNISGTHERCAFGEYDVIPNTIALGDQT